MVAQCEGGAVKRQNVSKPLVELPKAHMARCFRFGAAFFEDQLDCLTMEPKGCKAITEKLSCLSRRDGSQQLDGLEIHGEPCVWCGGGRCTDGSEALCAPYGYLAQGAGKAFTALLAPQAAVARCRAPELVFSHADVDCLKPATGGCNQLRDMANCTSSKEARPYDYIAGFKAPVHQSLGSSPGQGRAMRLVWWRPLP